MCEAVLRALIRPLIAAAIRDAAEDPTRAIRNLLEKARPYLDSGTYQKIYAAGQTLARDEANCAIVRRIAAGTDAQTLTEAAVCAACGAFRCLGHFRREGTLPRWRASFDLDAAPPALLSRLAAEWKRKGAFVFFLYGRKMPPGLARALAANEGCLFLLFLREPPGAEALRGLAVCHNAAVFVECDTPAHLERALPLAKQRCLWGAYTAVREGGAAAIPAWARMVSAHATLACVEPEPGCGEAVGAAVRAFRHDPVVPLLLTSPRSDLERLDRTARERLL